MPGKSYQRLPFTLEGALIEQAECRGSAMPLDASNQIGAAQA
jgi:hypothetical protein